MGVLPDKQWHPLFVTAVREALSDALPGQVDIQAEVALSSRPLDIDVLVVKKDQETRLSHPMAGFFRHYNVFEFKSPEDYLAANDYYKGMALAFLYKALEHERLLTMDDFTLTLEVLVQMAAQIDTAERARVREVLKKSLLGREMMEEGEKEGKKEGKIEAKQEVIQNFLLRRFGSDSPGIQKEVQQLNDLEVLDRVLTDLFASTSLEEARGIIAGGLRNLAGRSQP